MVIQITVQKIKVSHPQLRLISWKQGSMQFFKRHCEGWQVGIQFIYFLKYFCEPFYRPQSTTSSKPVSQNGFVLYSFLYHNINVNALQFRDIFICKYFLKKQWIIITVWQLPNTEKSCGYYNYLGLHQKILLLLLLSKSSSRSFWTKIAGEICIRNVIFSL